MLPRDLRDKYLRLRALREEHARALRDPTYAEPDPRAALTRLAADFPGALREIDRLPASVIEARIAELDAVLDGAPVARWMEAQLLFHARARAVLAAKRGLGRARTPDDAHRARFAEVADELDRIAAPPGGRLMPLVTAWVAAQLGVPEDETRRLIFDF